MIKNVKTDFLFAQPGFGSGVARNLDLWVSLTNTTEAKLQPKRTRRQSPQIGS